MTPRILIFFFFMAMGKKIVHLAHRSANKQ